MTWSQNSKKTKVKKIETKHSSKTKKKERERKQSIHSSITNRGILNQKKQKQTTATQEALQTAN